MNIQTLIIVLIVCVLLTRSTSMPVANAQPTSTSLTITVPSNPSWKACTIDATLTDENENPLPNTYIDFYACGERERYDCMNWIATAKTDSQGVASLTYTFSRTEDYVVTAIFSGTPTYAQSSSDFVGIIILDSTPYLVGGGLIVVAVMGVVAHGKLMNLNYKKLSLRIVSTVLLMVGLFCHFYTFPGWWGNYGQAPHPYWGYDFPLIGLAITGFIVGHYYPTSRKGQILMILVMSFWIIICTRAMIARIYEDILGTVRFYA